MKTAMLLILSLLQWTFWSEQPPQLPISCKKILPILFSSDYGFAISRWSWRVILCCAWISPSFTGKIAGGFILRSTQVKRSKLIIF